jgi:penicillin-binding protein 1A
VFRADARPCEGCSNVAWHEQPVPVIPDTSEQVADPGSAYQMVQMMEGVVQRGTGTAVKAVDRPIAGKTGTTNDYRDAWFVGFTPDLAAGVYVGYDTPDSLGKDQTGGHVAAPIFRDFMIAALANMPPADFRIPPGLRLYRVDPASGLPAAGNGPAIDEAYKPGTAPGQRRAPSTEAKSEEESTAEDMPSDAAPGNIDPDSGAAADAAAGPRQGAPAPLAVHGPAGGTGGLY